MKYCFGVDVGGTTVKIGLFQADGVLVDKWEIKTRTENKGEAIISFILISPPYQFLNSLHCQNSGKKSK